MTLDKHKFALAAAGAMGVVFVVCAIFTALWPDTALRLFGMLVHLVNIEKSAVDMRLTAGGFVGGLLQSVAYTYIGAWIFAWLHNRFGEKPSQV